MIAPAAPAPPSLSQITRAVDSALEEDLGLAGDVTSALCIPPGRQASLSIIAREAGVLAGLCVVAASFTRLDPAVRLEASLTDGERFGAGSSIVTVSGDARAILAAERTALNYLGRMSGIASLTTQYVARVAGTGVRIADTRKTMPGLRVFDKYAVRCGGGHNHRFGLFDAILIKDNHIGVAGGVAEALRAARARAGHLVAIEIEIDRLEDLDAVLREGATAVLLDNMSEEELREGVQRIRAAQPGMRIEASGGVDLESVRAIAETGVDLISVGALTHSARQIDFGLDIAIAEP